MIVMMMKDEEKEVIEFMYKRIKITILIFTSFIYKVYLQLMLFILYNLCN